MGTGFTIDTPLKVAKYGINSVISLVDDILIEQVHKHYCEMYDEPFYPVHEKDEDPRAKRITTYLNFVNKIITQQIEDIKAQSFENNSELVRYFELLPEKSSVKKQYLTMQKTIDIEEKQKLQEDLRKYVKAGSVDVNIMTKLNKENYNLGKRLSYEYADALAALRGFANSDLCSSVVFSAGLNRRLYSYAGEFEDFIYKTDGIANKKVILKVSDYYSAIVQGKFLAKKGVWISEYRIESGLNCGGHALDYLRLLVG